MGSSQDLNKLLEQQDLKIKALETLLQNREQELMQLRSQLDKYQSIIPSINATQKKQPGRKRGVGISAEPQALVAHTLHELQEQSTRILTVVPKSAR